MSFSRGRRPGRFRAQNKDSKAVSLKLNEIVAAIEGASNRLIDIEDLSEKELDTLHRHAELARMAKRDGRITKSHSIEEAEARHVRKQRVHLARPAESPAAGTE